MKARRNPPPPPDTTAPPQYLFIVARERSDILARARQRFDGDPRIEVIADRRFGERRRLEASAPARERRAADRRQRGKLWTDLSVQSAVVVQKHRETTPDPQVALEALVRERDALREEVHRLHDEIADLSGRLEALAVSNAAVKAELSAVVREAERLLRAVRQRDMRADNTESPRAPLST